MPAGSGAFKPYSSTHKRLWHAQDMLLPPELEFLLEQDRPTFGVVCCMSYIVSAAKLPYELQQSMDNEIRASLQEFGASDDILRQPLPSAYTRSASHRN